MTHHSFPLRVFSIGPMPAGLRQTFQRDHAPVRITELPWDPASSEPPEVQAAHIYQMYLANSGTGRALGERVLCVPRDLHPVVFFLFLALAARDDYSLPHILAADMDQAKTPLELLVHDAAISALRNIASTRR
jgi:hypothetical protein